MAQANVDHQMLTGYILGTMSEADRLVLSKRYFADDELFDRLLEVENDLLNQYVKGQLKGEERERFERYFQHLPESEHKTGVATALMKVVSEEQPPATAEAEQDSWWRSMLVPAQKPRLALLYSLVTILLVSVIGVIWLAIHSKKLSQENEQLRAKMGHLEIEQKILQENEELRKKVTQLEAEQKALEENAQILQQQSDDQQRLVGQLQKDLRQELQRSTAKAPQIVRRQQGLSSAVISLVLTAASRDSTIPDTLHLKPGTKFVSLIAPIEGRQKYQGGYRAVIQTTEGKLVWEKQSSRPVPSGKGLALRLAASQLPPASY